MKYFKPLLLLLVVTGGPGTGAAPPDFSILVFTITNAGRHESIPARVAALEDLGRENGFSVVHSENLNDINVANLSRFPTLVWMNTTGNMFEQQHKDALMSYIQAGGGGWASTALPSSKGAPAKLAGTGSAAAWKYSPFRGELPPDQGIGVPTPPSSWIFPL